MRNRGFKKDKRLFSRGPLGKRFFFLKNRALPSWPCFPAEGWLLPEQSGDCPSYQPGGVEGLGFRVQGLGFRLWRLRLKGSRVEGLKGLSLEGFKGLRGLGFQGCGLRGRKGDGLTQLPSLLRVAYVLVDRRLCLAGFIGVVSGVVVGYCADVH